MNKIKKINNFGDLKRPPVRYTEGLPILERKEEILSAILQNQVVIVAGETGSGKTTQLPIICLEAGRGKNGKIGCTQPRRIAAVSIARRVAEELHCSVGEHVGYKIRFHDHDSPHTCIKYMTDGILLAEVEIDPHLSLYDTLIIDEAHERSLNIDFILGHLKNILPERPDLKVIISSATIDTALFSKAFGNAPVIEVSGRLFPVELLYLNYKDEDYIEETYVDSAVKAAQDLLDLYSSGDMLIFMPAERDIRETVERLRGMKRPELLVLPLFSRLSKSEQEAIFNGFDKRKIVVSTNIAETSITVPNIRFVIDTGLARVSRYVPRLRTNRLPIEPISKAAADQRMGRCGRVMEGLCIRLFSEKNYKSREDFTLPEIKRANLAGVILSMIAHNLGDIEKFPFLEPPSRSSVSEGYQLLRELGAIDSENRLTVLGRKMAQLPIDPHIARMVIAAKEENALREVLIIAAALSIVDPRERPFEKSAEADAMHRKFMVPGSDFLSYVKLWDEFRQEWESLKTQNRIRKFCKDNFLSYTRMQEWHDVHQMLLEKVTAMKGFTINEQPASSDAIHRSLLSGLLSNCAMKTETGQYRASRGRDVFIFPGSALRDHKPQWIFCHQIVETSQLFARTVAPVNPLWLEQLGKHLCTRSYSEPYFDRETGVVRAAERIYLFGLQIAEHAAVSFGKINPEKACAVFIRQGLVEEQLNTFYRFYNHNKMVRREVEKLEEKLRSRSFFAGESAIESFYSERLTNVTSVHDLNRIIRQKGGDDFLLMKKEDILVNEIPQHLSSLPDRISIGGKKFELKYRFAPGNESDGITLKVPVSDAAYIPESSLEYLVPALWPEKILEHLRSLPKEIRKKLMPLNEKATELSQILTLSAETFETNLSKAIKSLYGVDVEPDLLIASKLPDHLTLRVEVHEDNGKVITSGRGGTVLRDISRNPTRKDEPWEEAYRRHEKKGLTDWTIGSMPAYVEVTTGKNSIPLLGYPALKKNEDSVDYVLCRSAEDARVMHRDGVKKLMEILLVKEYAWIDRELKFTENLRLLCAPFGGADLLRKSLTTSIHEFLLDYGTEAPRSRENFDSIMENARVKSKGIGYKAVELLEKIILSYNHNCALIKKEKQGNHQILKKELLADLGSYRNELLSNVKFERFCQFPRYMKAFGFRIQRAFLEPVKYGQKRAELMLFYTKLKEMENTNRDVGVLHEIEEYRIMVEEYAISLFAQQEVKTLFPISVKRLEKKASLIQQSLKNADLQSKRQN
jgi:ATP-dependent helicase HrpA